MGGRGGSGRSAAVTETPAAARAEAAAAPRDDMSELLDAIRVAGARLAINAEPGMEPLGILQLRNELASRGWDRGKQDRLILQGFRQRKFTLTPYTNRKILTPEDRAAAISVGNEDKGVIMMLREKR
jgi:hypothetical protein